MPEVHPDAETQRAIRYHKAAKEGWSVEFIWNRHAAKGKIVSFSAKFWTMTVELWEDGSIVDLQLNRQSGIRVFPPEKR